MTRFKFSKMHGNGNDFLVFDATQAPFSLSAVTLSRLANRHLGVGADQILIVEKSSIPSCDFRYRIFNADGGEVEQCGNGARCFTRFVYEKGLTDKPQIAIETKAGIIYPEKLDSGLIKINMGKPSFSNTQVGFDTSSLPSRLEGQLRVWEFPDQQQNIINLSVVSMGNPHTVLQVKDLNGLLVQNVGSYLESHPRFAHRVNVGFMKIIDPNYIQLRVYERGVGETLACGSGACAAVVIGIRAGWLSERVQVATRGGPLTVEWQGKDSDSVFLTGDAQFVFDFEGEIHL
jgi:diaminopimelate epimerase